MNEADKNGDRDAGQASTPGTSARARLSPSRELAERFAALLEEPDSHQLGVCAQLGIVYRTHQKWMAAEPEDGSELAEYQSLVLAALDRQRKLALENGRKTLDNCHPAKAGSYFNMFKFEQENRFRRFYDDGEQKHKVELTGANGGPVETNTAVRYVVHVPEDEPEE